MFVALGMTATGDFEAIVRRRFGGGPAAEAILAAYPHETPEETAASIRNLVRDAVFAWHAWTWARLQAESGRFPAYLYYFDHRAAGSPDGANHAAEVGYVFGRLGPMGNGPLALLRRDRSSLPTAEDEALSELMMSYWTNFARTGDPNGPGLPPWPAFRTERPRVMHFDDHSGAREGVPNVAQLRAIDRLYRREGPAAGGD